MSIDPSDNVPVLVSYVTNNEAAIIKAYRLNVNDVVLSYTVKKNSPMVEQWGIEEIIWE